MIKAYIDIQNARRNLAPNMRYNLFSLNLRALIDEMAEGVGETCVETHRGYTGIHKREIDQVSHDRDHRKYMALRYQQGISVFTRDFEYLPLDNGSLQPREKGIDVRMACELVADVKDECGATTGAILWTADQDLSEAVNIASGIAASMGRSFPIYCVETEGVRPLKGAIPIKLTQTMLYRHLRQSNCEGQAIRAPMELVVAAAQQASRGVHA